MAMETSHFWLGLFTSEEQLDAYFEEQYENDDAPISRFAADQGKMYYDHDWVECGFDESGDLRILIKGASYSSDYLEKVIDAAIAQGIATANAYILADSDEFADPKSVNSSEYKLWYLGKYNCTV